MFHGWGFWSLCWLLLNILTWLFCLFACWRLVREIRQLRPASELKRDPHPDTPRGGP